MAYTAFSIPTTPFVSKNMDMTKEHNNVLFHSHYSKKLCTKLISNNKKHWINRIRKSDMDPTITCKNRTYDDEFGCDDDEEFCVVDYEEGDDDEQESVYEYDCDSLSKFLVHVPWSDAKLYSQLAFLCDMAYVIQQIKAMDLRRYYGLQLITSSMEMKAKLKAKFDQINDSVAYKDGSKKGKDNGQNHQIQIVYDIAAFANSYVQLGLKELLSFATESMKKNDNEDDSNRGGESQGKAEEGSDSEAYKPEIAAYYAKSTMTAVVAACEREIQEAEKDLQLLHSSPSPFEWFVCDNSSNYTRLFVIQGLDSLASWHATLLFEPTKFEDTNALVHRGIYEAAKAIYEQIMPLIMDHLKRHGEYAKLQFSGHCIGGSISLLVHLMLLTRKIVIPSNLRPVVTFGSPFVLCGGQKVLYELGLDENHIHCVIMHRDIVPRAFSCNYPEHIAIVLKHLNRSFQSLPSLMKKKLLYSPLGKIFILQPDQRTSPPHPLLPSGSALYALDSTKSGYSPSVLGTFLNQPHPFETLIDPKAYGSEGTIVRDHDSSNYLNAANGVLREHSKFLVQSKEAED